MTEFATAEAFLDCLRNVEALEAYFCDDCPGCRLITAYIRGSGRHFWHEPGCPRMARKIEERDDQ